MNASLNVIDFKSFFAALGSTFALGSTLASAGLAAGAGSASEKISAKTF